tara:strand:- start:241 stop:642 length:402 start_codon:yes stop_codon:yes gene_type:complete
MSSEEYDNTNKGAVFPPFSSDDKLMLTGKLDMEGQEHKLAVVKEKTKNGKIILKVYTEFCALFENDSVTEGAPKYSGSLNERFNKDKPMRLAAWKRQTKDGKNMLSLQVSEKLSKQNSTTTNDSLPIDDEIPF